MWQFDYIEAESEKHKTYLHLIGLHAEELELSEDWFHQAQESKYFNGKVPADMMLSEKGARDVNRILESILDDHA